MSHEELTLEDYQQYLEDRDMLGTGARYSGLLVGSGVQLAEHSPEKFEAGTGIDIPEKLFEEVYDPFHMDKAFHAGFCYSAAAVILDTMENSDTEYNLIHKSATVNLATLFAGSIKEFTDNVYDLGDMAANMVGTNAALSHHMDGLSVKYEEDFDLEIESRKQLIQADILYQEFLKKDLDPSDIKP